MYESCHTYESVMSHIRMSHVTHTYKNELEIDLGDLTSRLFFFAEILRWGDRVWRYIYIYIHIHAHTFII